MSKDIALRTPREIAFLLDMVSSTKLPKTIRHYIGESFCDEATASAIAVAFNRKWVVNIKPALPQGAGQLTLDDARLKHADNIMAALRELGEASRNSGNAVNVKDRAVALYDARVSDTGCRRTEVKGERRAAIPNAGFRFR